MASINVRLWNPGRRMLLVMVFLAALTVMHQFLVFPYDRYLFDSSPGKNSTSFVTIRSSHPGYALVHEEANLVEGVDADLSKSGQEGENNGVSSVGVKDRDEDDAFDNDISSLKKFNTVENEEKQMLGDNSTDNNGNETVYRKTVEDARDMDVYTNFSTRLTQINMDVIKPSSTLLNTSGSLSSSALSHRIKQVVEMHAKSRNRMRETILSNDSLVIERYVRKMRGVTITLSDMNTMLLKGPGTPSTSMKRKWSSSRDRELYSASLQIKNALVMRDFPDLHAPLFRNASVFKRSYELMTRLLKIHIYKEGEKPIFHQPKLRGVYAAEGWFMKLIERSKRFVVRDPRKAHLYYLPFSSNLLRVTLQDENSHSMKKLEHYLIDYVDLIKKKYHFWNRTRGADHFFVACHDWGPQITRSNMNSCIRALCNANVARGFSIGKDVSVPVTYVRSGNDPTSGIGGKPPSERDILAFFAGQMHGYVRPLLLQYWGDKAADMKILGPMERSIEGKAVYREYMKNSKYCICARGYGVHTPRVVESIFYECVPVVISDNYVPPFFEVLDWEAFAVFVQEKDIPNLRNILLSIPEDRYLDMQKKVQMVQQHFTWHKDPQKFDLFHMILHSIWYSRVSRMRSK